MQASKERTGEIGLARTERKEALRAQDRHSKRRPRKQQVARKRENSQSREPKKKLKASREERTQWNKPNAKPISKKECSAGSNAALRKRELKRELNRNCIRIAHGRRLQMAKAQGISSRRIASKTGKLKLMIRLTDVSKGARLAHAAAANAGRPK